MVCGMFVAAVAGMFGYLTLGFAFRSLWRGLYFIYVLIPLLIGFLILGGISRGLLTEERAERPGIGRHLWHCAAFYPVVLWTAYQMIDCPRQADLRPIPARCADPMGISLALGLASLAAILADSWVVWRRRRVRRSSNRILICN